MSCVRFTEKNETSLKEFLKDDFALYAESIIISKKGNLKKSMKLLIRLLEIIYNSCDLSGPPKNIIFI